MKKIFAQLRFNTYVFGPFVIYVFCTACACYAVHKNPMWINIIALVLNSFFIFFFLNRAFQIKAAIANQAKENDIIQNVMNHIKEHFENKEPENTLN